MLILIINSTILLLRKVERITTLLHKLRESHKIQVLAMNDIIINFHGYTNI